MDELQKILITKMMSAEIINENHKLSETLIHGIPRHLAGDAKKALEKLAKQGYLMKHPTRLGLAYSIDPARIVEIQEILETP